MRDSDLELKGRPRSTIESRTLHKKELDLEKIIGEEEEKEK